MGTIKDQVTGFEAGILVDTYSRDIELMLNRKQYSVFPTLFLTLFYGSRR